MAFFPIGHTDRAKTAGRKDGFVKLITAPHPLTRTLVGGQLVGAAVVGPTAGDLVGQLALAMRARVHVGRLAQTMHPYPSWGLALRETAAQFFGGGYKGRSARSARQG